MKSPMRISMRIWKQRVGEKFLEFLRQGLSPEKLAQSVAYGTAFGTFPVLGLTAILCTVASAVLRLNLAATQLVNLLLAPVQLALLLPLIRLGELLFHQEALSLSLDQILNLVASDPLSAIRLLWWSTMRALVAWIFVGPPAGLAGYLLFKPVFVKAAKTLGIAGGASTEPPARMTATQ